MRYRKFFNIIFYWSKFEIYSVKFMSSKFYHRLQFSWHTYVSPTYNTFFGICSLLVTAAEKMQQHICNLFYIVLAWKRHFDSVSVFLSRKLWILQYKHIRYVFCVQNFIIHSSHFTKYCKISSGHFSHMFQTLALRQPAVQAARQVVGQVNNLAWKWNKLWALHAIRVEHYQFTVFGHVGVSRPSSLLWSVLK